MKIETSKTLPSFTPCSITFTFQTQAELDAMGVLFNTWAITNALNKAGKTETFTSIHEELEKLGANLSATFQYVYHFATENDLPPA